MGYDYNVTYKKGKENSAADALSRVPMEGDQSESQLNAISVIQNPFFDRIKNTYPTDTPPNQNPGVYHQSCSYIQLPMEWRSLIEEGEDSNRSSS